jgi:hypothetical protein
LFTLQTNLNNEAATRAAADTTLQGNLDNEAATRASADTALQGNLDNEAAARIAADTSETTARTAADVALQDNINVEAATRAAADQALQDDINSNTATIAVHEAAINQEVADRTALIRQDKDGSIHIGANSLITNEVGGEQQLYARDASLNPININVTNGSDLLVDGVSVATDADVAAERASRISADNELRNDLNDEVAARQSADYGLSKRIDKNTRGIAMVAAMTNTTIQSGMHQAVDFNMAHFEGETGFAFGYANKINENLQVHAGAASTADFEESVVRLGFSYQW